jgi:hypothetical protein
MVWSWADSADRATWSTPSTTSPPTISGLEVLTPGTGRPPTPARRPVSRCARHLHRARRVRTGFHLRTHHHRTDAARERPGRRVDLTRWFRTRTSIGWIWRVVPNLSVNPTAHPALLSSPDSVQGPPRRRGNVAARHQGWVTNRPGGHLDRPWMWLVTGLEARRGFTRRWYAPKPALPAARINNTTSANPSADEPAVHPQPGRI